jgi:predicted transport protein
MSDIKLFRYGDGIANELQGISALVEKQLQSLIESQMSHFLGISFLASEYATGKTHKGRIDSLGIDENYCPIIIEYKRHTNENVINQGLYYLDWLLDHKAEFKLLVMEKIGKDAADKIEWQGTRLLCIAADFTKYDGHAVAQIRRNIELIRYKLFGSDLLLLELVNAVTVKNTTTNSVDDAIQEEIIGIKVDSQQLTGLSSGPTSIKASSTKGDKTFAEQLTGSPIQLAALYADVAAFINSLGDDIQEKELKLYTAFRRLRNFACAIILPKNDPKICLILKLDPATVELQDGFVRDVSKIGHWGTGDVEVMIRDEVSFDKAKSLIERSYQEN